MRLLERIFAPRVRGDVDTAYRAAMGVSSELIEKMREYSSSNDAARAVMADVWAQRHNIPFLTSTFETVQEMKEPRANGAYPPALPK